MRSLLLISSLFLIFSSCCKLPHNNLSELKQPVNTDFLSAPINLCIDSSILFKTEIEVFNYYVSGLMFVKKTNQDVIHINFLNEFGVKFFDFKFVKGNFKVNYCIRQLNKKIILRTLEKDLKLLFLEKNKYKKPCYSSTDSQNEKLIIRSKKCEYDLFYFQTGNYNVNKIENIKNKKMKISLELRNYIHDIPKNVVIKHLNFPLKLNLILINKS